VLFGGDGWFGGDGTRTLGPPGCQVASACRSVSAYVRDLGRYSFVVGRRRLMWGLLAASVAANHLRV